MSEAVDVQGRDIQLSQLIPLNARKIDLQKSRGYRKILCSIKSVGMIEPLSVYEEDGRFFILDGYLRYMACKQLGMAEIPCIVHDEKEAYTFNRMVNQLSGHQEMKMLRKAMEKVDRKVIAEAFGLATIRYRLSPKLLKKVHRDVARAFEEDLISRNAVKELSSVKMHRQAEIVAEMRRTSEYSLKFIRAMILNSDPDDRMPGALRRKTWTQNSRRHRELTAALREAEQQHDFYTRLYREYTTDLLRMVPYVRRVITNPRLTSYLEAHHSTTLQDFRSIVFEEAAT